MAYTTNTVKPINISLLPFYCTNKFKVYVDKNHDVYANQQTIYDEIFKYLGIQFHKYPIKLCEEQHFTKLVNYKYTSNIPDYLKTKINENISNLGNLRKFVRDFEFETTWDFWDIIDYIMRNKISITYFNNKNAHDLLFISNDYRLKLCEQLRNKESFLKLKTTNSQPTMKEKSQDIINDKLKFEGSKYENSVYKSIVPKFSESRSALPSESFENKITIEYTNSLGLKLIAKLNYNKIIKLDFDDMMFYLVRKFKIDIDKYRFDYNKYINKFKPKIIKYPNLFKYKCDTTYDTFISDGKGNYIKYGDSRDKNSKYLITYSDKSQFDGIESRKYEVVYTPNVQIPLIVGTRFIYSPNEKYYLSKVEIGEKQNDEIEKIIKTKYGMMKTIQKLGLRYRKYPESYKYSKYLSDLVVNESELYKVFMKEYSPTELFEYDIRKELRNYETFKKYTKDSNSIILLIHHLICFQNIEPDDKEVYCLYKDMIYDLYFLQMSYIIEIIGTCSFSKVYAINKYLDEN